MSSEDAVLLLAHGTPETTDEIPEYLKNVTSGRPMPESVVEEIRHRYSLIGKSPLTELTMAQAQALENELGLRVYVGMRNWKPYVSETVRTMRADGVRRAVAICLAPQNSRTSVGLYKRAAYAEAGDQIQLDFVEAWADHPLLIDAFQEKLAEVWMGTAAPVLFTAHSVPCRTIFSTPAVNGGAAVCGDPYPVEAKRTAALVAERFRDAGLQEQDWYFAFQSQGMSGGPWIGPTVEDTMRAIHSSGQSKVVIQTIGFLCDHVEVLYDIDIAFRQLGEEIGLEVVRAQSLNTSPKLIAALKDLAQQGLARLKTS